MQLAAIDPFNYRQIELFCLAFSSEIQRSPAARLDEAARFTVPPTFLSFPGEVDCNGNECTVRDDVIGFLLFHAFGVL